MELFYHEEAFAEYQNAVLYYKNLSAEYSKRFVRSVEYAISLIREQPTAFTKISKNIRRCILFSFPYSIFYTLLENKIVIIAIAHQKRRPEYWKRRKP